MSRGFTLIELIIGLALTVGALALFGVILSTVPLTRESRNQNIVYKVAGKKIEELRVTPFASLPSSGVFTDSGLNDLTSSTAVLTVSDFGGNTEIKQINVSITWDEEGTARNLSLDTLIIDGGLSQ